MKLSIIVAMYNTEPYIRKCIDSVYDGDFLSLKDFEVIVVNDGSTDLGVNIVEELMLKYHNLKLINKDNGGQSSARNLGFKLAKGDYIFCLDSDDFVSSKYLAEGLNYCIYKDLDLLPIFFKRFSTVEGVLPDMVDNYSMVDDVINGAEFFERFTVSGAMCRYFYKREIIVDNDLYLMEGVFQEDEDFVTKFIAYSNRISYNKIPAYYYTIRVGSTTNNKDFKHQEKLIKDLVLIIVSLSGFSAKYSKDSWIYKGIKKKVNQLTISIFLKLYRDPELYSSVLMNEMVRNEVYPVGLFGLKLSQVLFAILCNNSYFYRFLLRIK